MKVARKNPQKIDQNVDNNVQVDQDIDKKCTMNSGGSRISPRRGRQLSRGDANIRFCQIFQKLHKIERIWTPGGGARPKFYYVDPPLMKRIRDDERMERRHEGQEPDTPFDNNSFL